MPEEGGSKSLRMKWRNNFEINEDVSHWYTKFRISRSYGSTAEFESLLIEIGDRDVVVDACLSPLLVRELRKRAINAVWVPEILGDGVSDDEIERQLLLEDSGARANKKREKVLLTRDVQFYRRQRSRAILVNHRTSLFVVGGLTKPELRKELKFIRQEIANQNKLSPSESVHA